MYLILVCAITSCFIINNTMTTRVIFRQVNLTSATQFSQRLHHNLHVACQARNTDLCLQAIAALVYWIPSYTPASVEAYCHHRSLPVLLVAGTLVPIDESKHTCLCLDDLTSTCPYVLQVHFAPRIHAPRILAAIPFDRRRPAWVRTLDENQSYLDKCGLLVPAHKADDVFAYPVIMGKTQLDLAQVT